MLGRQLHKRLKISSNIFGAFLIVRRVLSSHYQKIWAVTPISGQIFYAKDNASKLYYTYTWYIWYDKLLTPSSASDVGNIFYLMVSPAPQRSADRVSMLGALKRLAK